MYTFVRIFVKEGGRFLGKRYASNETLPVYGERERERRKGEMLVYGETKVSKEDRARERGRGSSGGGGEEEGGGRGEGVL